MKVSIIISVYNGEKFISRAIRSCLEQSMKKEDYEIIVINDGSTDNTGQILSSFDRDLIKVITLDKNMGLPFACNMGIKKAFGRFVVRVDADDYVHEDFLKVGYLYLSMDLDINAVAFDYHLVDEIEDKVKRMSAEENPIACGIFFRKDYLIDIGLYDPEFRLGEDEDLRIRFLKKYSIENVKLPLYRYHLHGNNSTNNIEGVKLYKQKLKQKHNI